MKLTTSVLLALLLCATGAVAGTIVVSGDSNLGNGIDGSGGAPFGDNGVFFSNLLGSGMNVVLQPTTNGDTFTEVSSQNAIIAYYTGLGKTVSTVTTVTSGSLAGANLFIGFLPDIAYTPSEISAISAFLSGGGTVLFTGEWVPFDPGADANINAALLAMGSTLQINPAGLDLEWHTATGSQIAINPLTSGVNSFVYAATSGVSGGTPLFYTTNGTPFVEVNTATVTPEPGSLILLGSGLIGLAGVLRRKISL